MIKIVFVRALIVVAAAVEFIAITAPVNVPVPVLAWLIVMLFEFVVSVVPVPATVTPVAGLDNPPAVSVWFIRIVLKLHVLVADA